MSGMCEDPVRVRGSVDAYEITFCYDFLGGFNLWVKTNMQGKQDAQAEIDTGIFFLKLNFFIVYFFKKLTLNLPNKWKSKFQILTVSSNSLNLENDFYVQLPPRQMRFRW